MRIDKDGTLLVPVIHYSLKGQEIALAGLQKIAPDGSKLFNKGMAKTGAALMLGKPVDAPVIAIGEGYATCRSVRMAFADELPVMVAFDAGNLLAVARSAA